MPEGELVSLRRALQVDDVVSLTMSSDDVETAKPEPGIVQVAVERARVDACDVAFVGDSLWDVEAAKRAGVRCVALGSGGTGVLELFTAGAFFGWDHAAELLARYRETFE